MDPTLNLIYHLAPFKNANYLKHLHILKHHSPSFNGVKVISIAEGPELADLHKLAPKLLPDFKILYTKNDQEFGELASWPNLITALKAHYPTPPSLTSKNYTLYAHGKGTSKETLADRENPTTATRAIQLWTNMLYFLNFHPEQLSNHLAALATNNYLISGALKREGKTTNMPEYCDFYYQGNFFWVNTNHLLTNTRQPSESKFGIEAFPSRICHIKNANNTFPNTPTKRKSLYNYNNTYELSQLLPQSEWKAYKVKLHELATLLPQAKQAA